MASVRRGGNDQHQKVVQTNREKDGREKEGRGGRGNLRRTRRSVLFLISIRKDIGKKKE